jgi:uncharacterized protein YdhG (YjbR/CyaY superfamily)
MKKKESGDRSIDEYIRSFPVPVRKKLSEIRRIVRELAPDAQEKISYRMPAFFLKGSIAYFAGFSKHIGFYPGANCITAFKSELARYKCGRGSVQFPLDEQLPIDVIHKMVKYNIEANLKKKG